MSVSSPPTSLLASAAFGADPGVGADRILLGQAAVLDGPTKALGTGMRRGVFWRDMGVINMRSGQPTMALTGGALARLHEMTPDGMRAVIHLTLTDDHPYAQAFVIIEALPE